MTTPQGTLSVQLYSIRDAVAADLPGTLARLAEIGYRNVEPFGLGSGDASAEARHAKARALREAADAAGLGINSVHAAVDPDDLGTLVEECRILGTDTVFLPVPGMLKGTDSKVFEDAEGLAAFAAQVNDAAARLEQDGVRLGYHNHEFEWAGLPDGRSGYDLFWELADERVLAELDVYWATVAGKDPAEVLAMLGARTVAVHLKDGPATRGEPQTPIGTGVVDIRGAVDALAAANPSAPALWHIAEIDVTEEDDFALLAKNRATLLEYGRTVA